MLLLKRYFDPRVVVGILAIFAAFAAITAIPADAYTGLSATSSSSDGNEASNVIDGDRNTRWSANGDGQWVQIDLGSAYNIRGVELAFYKGDQRKAYFGIQTSTDGNNWSTVIDNAASNGSTTGLQSFYFDSTNAQFVRYVGFGNENSQWNSITEMEAIPGDGSPTPPTPPTPTPPTPTPPTPTPPTPTPPTPNDDRVNLPGTIEAEEWTSQDGIQNVDGRDGGSVVGYVNNGDSTSYDVAIANSGSVNANVRVASPNSNSTITFVIDGKSVGSVKVPNTGAWTTFTTVSTTLNLPSGNKTLTMEYSGSDKYLLDVNWVAIGAAPTTPTPPTTTTTAPPAPPTTTTTTTTTAPPKKPGGSLDWDMSIWDAEGRNPIEGNVMVFNALEEKHVTPNGNGWRHELKIKPSERFAMSKQYEEFSADITADISDGSKLIAAQHHASDTGTIVKLYISDTNESGFDDSKASNGIFDVYVRMAREDGSGEDKFALGTIKSGDTFDFKVVNDHGFVTVWSMGRKFGIDIEDSTASYFKFGNYLQAQDPETGDDVDDKDDWADFYKSEGITKSDVTFSNLYYTRDID